MTIDDYLAELERELRRRRAPRARLLREAEDHLRDLCAELAADGLADEQAEARAVARFGGAATIAARFAEATASTSAHRAVTVAAAAFVAYAGVVVAFAIAASPLLRDFPQGAGSFLALQPAALALGVALVRSLRWRGVPATPTAELTAIARPLRRRRRADRCGRRRCCGGPDAAGRRHRLEPRTLADTGLRRRFRRIAVVVDRGSPLGRTGSGRRLTTASTRT